MPTFDRCRIRRAEFGELAIRGTTPADRTSTDGFRATFNTYPGVDITSVAGKRRIKGSGHFTDCCRCC
jgi:hypothetical protein